jgi:acyl-CoA thioesterase YciA
MIMKNGKLAIQILAMPCNTNPSGDIFGGWIVSQMDLAAGTLVKRISHGRAATVSIDSISFLAPVHVGDLVSCYVEPLELGRTSLMILVEVWVTVFKTGEERKVTEGVFKFVALDDNGKPKPIKLPT